MRSVIIKSDQNKRYLKSLIDEIPLDGGTTVDIKKTAQDSTSAQRRLQWMWNGEVAQSGLGRNDTKDGVHLTAKWMFARPILLRDDEVFGAIYAGFFEVIVDHPADIQRKYIKQFTRQYISTEGMSKKQRAEYLTEFQRYWVGKGVNLTDPALQGVDLNKWRVAA